MIELAAQVCAQADIFLIIGTSLQVYPAAGLVQYVPRFTPVYVVDPKPVSIHSGHQVEHIAQGATKGMKELLKKLKDEKK